jgi:5'-3' exonuclease
MGIGSGAKDQVAKLCDVANSGVSTVSLSTFKDLKVAVDWSNIGYRFLSRSKNIAEFRNEFINLIHKFAREGIELIFVFDGKPRCEKFQTIEHRKNSRAKVLDKIKDIIENVSNPEEDFKTIVHLAKRIRTLTIQHINECKKLFDSLGVKYIHLENIEADSIFKLLLENKFADICFSCDMDILAFGCKRIIQDLNFKDDTVVEIDYAKLLAYLEVSQQQLLSAFILSGTDWNNGLKKSNFEKNLALIKKYGDIPNTIANLEAINNDLPEDMHIVIPNRFDWKFSISVYSEQIDSDIIFQIQEILKQQDLQTEKIKSQKYGYNMLFEYGKSILANETEFKYIRKYQEYIFWKFAYRINISYSIFKQKKRVIYQLGKNV